MIREAQAMMQSPEFQAKMKKMEKMPAFQNSIKK
jgi:hypothetical protein